MNQVEYDVFPKRGMYKLVGVQFLEMLWKLVWSGAGAKNGTAIVMTDECMCKCEQARGVWGYAFPR